MRDLANNQAGVPAIAPAVQSASINGAVVDLLDCNGVTFFVNTGAIVGAGDFTAKVQESDESGSGFTDVAAGDLVGAFSASLSADGVEKVGYIGNKRYARVVLTKNGGTSIAAGAVAVKGHLAVRPAA
ncbi:hypothetical protein [Mesorhizobium marinum]|uniref:hypothetical protein n=1 Tax=Mesorhizobium marinum TaxID=3228790 RepID=UPI0034655019